MLSAKQAEGWHSTRIRWQYDYVDKAMRAVLRADRAPKGGLQKQLEGLISSENPRKSK